MGQEKLREVGLHFSLFVCVFHIDTKHFGHLDASVTMLDFGVAVFAVLGVEEGFDGGGCGAEDGARVPGAGQIDGAVARVVAWRGVGLLVAAVVFLVDDDEAEVIEGQEKCGASAEEEPEPLFAGIGGALPDFGTFLCVEARMVDADGVAEIAT